MVRIEAMNEPIYMDCHATTPIDPRVLEAMMPALTGEFGNAASLSHAYGRRARDAVEAARAEVAALIGAAPDEIVFTSGATESDDLAIAGALAFHPRARVVTQATEHAAVLDTCSALERRSGARVVRLPVDREGHVDPAAVEAALSEETTLVSVMLANNEVGAVQDIGTIGALTRARGVLFHCDVAQGLGYLPLDVEAMGVDLLSISGHKLYGPKGVGALYVRRAIRDRLTPRMHGGGHQGGLRSGTMNVPGVIGLGRAASIMKGEGTREAERIAALRDRLFEGLASRIPETTRNGPPLGLGARHPGNLNVRFLHVEAAAVLVELFETLAVSSGSACSSERPAPSHVLLALGLSPEEAKSSLRFGLGRHTTVAEVERAIELVSGVVGRLRSRSPMWEMHLRGESIDW
jgi:cysteine desulfurase